MPPWIAPSPTPQNSMVGLLQKFPQSLGFFGEFRVFWEFLSVFSSEFFSFFQSFFNFFFWESEFCFATSSMKGFQVFLYCFHSSLRFEVNVWSLV